MTGDVARDDRARPHDGNVSFVGDRKKPTTTRSPEVVQKEGTAEQRGDSGEGCVVGSHSHPAGISSVVWEKQPPPSPLLQAMVILLRRRGDFSSGYVDTRKVGSQLGWEEESSQSASQPAQADTSGTTRPG